MHATIDDNHLKDLMKIALMELLEEHPAMLRGLMAEALEDMTSDRPHSERDHDEYEEEDAQKERGRRHSTRSRRSRTSAAPPPEFADAASEMPRRTSSGRTATSEYSTPGGDGVDTPGGRWDLHDEHPDLDESSLGATTSDYGTAFDPIFRKPTAGVGAAGAGYGNAAFHQRPPHPASATNSSSSGAAYLSRGLSMLLEPDLRPYVILPMVASILIFSIAIWLGMGQFGAFGGWTYGYLPFWLAWIDWLLWPVFTLAPVVMVFYFFALVANIFSASFNALLAEKVSRKLNGLPIGGGPGFGTALLRIPASLQEEWRKSMWFIMRALMVMVLFFIPLVNLAAPFIWILFSTWSLSLKYLDYPVANQDLEFDETRALAAENRWLVFEFGGAVLLMTIVPILNFVAMPAAVVGAATLWSERMAPRRNI